MASKFGLMNKELKNKIIQASVEAGREIMEVYNTEFAVEHKDDKSPLTEADKRSHEAIMKHLVETDYPVLSEEGRDIPYADRKAWKRFWLVDPLDGTKEFIKRNGEFTVNIALIEDGRPVAGVIYIPAKEELFVGVLGEGSQKYDQPLSSDWDPEKKGESIPTSLEDRPFAIVGSRSHMSEETLEFMEKIKADKGQVDIVSAGSSLKFCLVAEGKADAYPRYAPTMEWDTGAGQAICEAAGFGVYRHDDGTPLRYNKENLLNPWFIVR